MEDEGDLRNDRVVARITAQDLLNVMKRSMVTFKDFLEEDRSGVRSPGKFRRQLLSVDSPVENPNDLELFVTLSKQVNKVEINQCILSLSLSKLINCIHNCRRRSN